MTEAIIVHIRPFDDNLKSMRRTRLPLKPGQRWRKLFIRVLDLGHKPRLLVARHEEIHFAFLLVPYIKQIEFAKSEIRPPFNGLQQMAGDKRFRPLTGILNARPISQIPFRRLANRILYVLEVRPDRKAIIKGLQNRNPFLNRRLTCHDLARE